MAKGGKQGMAVPEKDGSEGLVHSALRFSTRVPTVFPQTPSVFAQFAEHRRLVAGGRLQAPTANCMCLFTFRATARARSALKSIRRGAGE